MNVETKYKSGQYLNLDATLMKSISESTRLGLSGYAVQQTTRDTRSEDPTNPVIAARQAPTLGQKGRVFGLGPEFAYIHGAGDYLIEARFMKEFSAENRPEGFTAIVALSKPF